MSEKVTIKVPRKLIDKVLEKAKEQFPYKEIDNYSKAALEVLYVFIEESSEEQPAELKAASLLLLTTMPLTRTLQNPKNKSYHYTYTREELADMYPTLDALFEAMQDGKLDDAEDDAFVVDWSDLPTYGGPDMENTIEIWSWDATRMITRLCSEEIQLVPRNDIVSE